MSDDGNAELDIVVLNWRTPELSVGCAEAAQRAVPGAALYVVDNGSGDGSPEILRRRLPRAHIVETGRNLGFGAGMNAGVNAGRRPYVLIVNSDARPVGDAFRLLLNYSMSDPRLGIVTPMTIDGQDRPVAQLRPEPPAWKVVAGSIPLVWRYVTDPLFLPTPGQPERLTWLPTLCVALFRRAAFDEIGGFDPGYFLGWEEWDITRRLHDRGWEIGIHRGAAVVHAGWGSVKKEMAGWRQEESLRARCYHLRKYHGPAWYAIGKVTFALVNAQQRLFRAARQR